MGEYFVLANPARQEYIDPDVFGNENNKRSGLLLNRNGAAAGLLLRTPSPQLPPHPLIGAWIGDVVIAAGDEHAADQIFGSDAPADISASAFVETTFQNVSYDAVDLLCTVDPSQALGLVDFICRYQRPDPQDLIRLGDTVLLLGTSTLQAALTTRLGDEWISQYVDACQAEHRYAYRLRPFGGLEQSHLQAVRERQAQLSTLPLIRTYQTDADHDVLVVNLVQRQFLSAQTFRLPGEMGGLYDGFVMRATRDLFTGLWKGDPIVVAGHDALPDILGRSTPLLSHLAYNLYELARTSFEDISEMMLDMMDWSDRSDFFHAKYAHMRRHPVDLYIGTYTAFRNGYSYEKYRQLAARLKQRSCDEHPDQREQIIHALTSDILDDSSATPPRIWSASFADYNTLEHDLDCLNTTLRHDLDRAVFMERVEADRGVLEFDRRDLAELTDAYTTKPAAGLIAASIWQSLVELHLPEYYDWGLFIQRQEQSA